MMDGLPVTPVHSVASTHSSASSNSPIVIGGDKLAHFDQNLGHWTLARQSEDGQIKVGSRPIEVFSQSQSGFSKVDMMLLADNSAPTVSRDSSWLEKKSVTAASAKFEQRPAEVFVDSPARIERNVDDPSYRLADRKYQATATIARTGKSRYWASWRADNKIDGEGPGNFAVLAYSDDNNKSMKEFGYLTYSPEHPGNQIVDPMLWTAPDGRLWLFYGVIGNNRHYDGVGGSWAVVCDNPNEKNPVWNKPVRLSYHGVPRRPVKIDDKWFMAIDGWRFSAEEPPIYMDHVGPHIYEFNWRDQKVTHVSQLPPNNNGQYSGFFETEFVHRKDGAVAALLRWQGKNSQIIYSVSKDGMQTWTPWQDYKVVAPSSSARTWLGRTPSGLILLAWNNDLVRRTLTVGLSDNEGASYKYKQVVEPDPNIQVSYPVVAFGDDGDIFVIYDNGRNTQKQIRVSKVNEKDIISGVSKPVVSIVSDPANP